MATLKVKPPFAFLLLLLLLLLSSQTQARLLSTLLDADAPFLRLGEKPNGTTPEACEQTYGVLPCTHTVVGNLFLMAVYGYLMFLAATFLSNGSELLLDILGPGIVGGLFLPILGALPDAILILASGLSGSKETAQSQVLIGMGLLAGSTVMLLTVLWGSCVVIGKCDLSENSTPIDSQDTKRFSLFGSGIATDLPTSHAARIMVISIIPFIIVQMPNAFRLHSAGRVMVLVGFIVSVVLLLSYCFYQIYQPSIQRRRLEYAKLKHVMAGILFHAHKQSIGRLLNSDGSPNIPVIKKLFQHLDQNKNNLVSRTELKAFLLGIQFGNNNLDEDGVVEQVMRDFDTSHDDNIDEEEFINGISKWIREAKRLLPQSGSYSGKFIHDFHDRAHEEHDMLIDEGDEATENVENRRSVMFKALALLVLGTAIAALFADPLVDAVHNFSTVTHIPSFFISFIAMPLATNSSEAVSAIIFASRKKKRTASLTFSEIYGAVTMNNTLCLAVFLALVYTRNLTWDFSSEVLIILIVCVVMGLFASFRTVFPLWTCSVAYFLYPFSLVLVYVLDYVVGWS